MSFFSEKTKNFFTIFLGFLLGILGLFLIGYSVYLLFFQSSKQEIMKLLPAENFRILMQINNTLPLPVESLLRASLQNDALPSARMIAGYYDKKTQKTVYFTIAPAEKNITPDAKKCISHSHYTWCLLSENNSHSFLYSLLEKTESGKPSLYHLSSFSNTDIFPSGSSLSFIGVTAYLPEMIESISDFIPTAKKEKTKMLLEALAPVAPLFSGSLQGNTYELTWYKKNDTPLFASFSHHTPFSSALFPATVDRYIMLKSPADIWNWLFANGDAKDFPELVALSGWGKQIIAESFQQKVSWQSDILPLLTQDMLIYSSPHGSSAIFSFSDSSLTKPWYEKFGKLIQQFAAQKVPTKKDHVLEDGTTISEVFPETKAIVEKRQPFLQGESLSFSAPNEVNAKTFPVTAYKENQLFLSTNDSSLSFFANPGMAVSSFVFPKNKNLFLAAGLKARSLEPLPILFAEIVGLEKGSEIKLIANIDWNTVYFISVPENGMIETPFPSLPPIALPTTSSAN